MIAAASEQQSSTSEEIARSVQSISTAAQESAVGVTQVSDTASDLERITGQLQESVQQFKVEANGPEAKHSEGTGPRATAGAGPTAAESAVGGDGHRGRSRS